MKHWYELDTNQFIEHLESGGLNDYLDEIIENFPKFADKPEVQFELIRYIKEKRPPVSLTTWVKGLGISEEDARKVYNNPYRIMNYVVIHGESGEISQMLIIKNTGSLITNLESVKKDLEVITSYVKSNFAVFFKTPFYGQSFMLPLTVGLLVVHIPSNLVFTGKVDEKGKVYDVEGVSIKRKVAQNSGYKLIDPSIVPDVSFIKRWLDAEIYHVPLCVTYSSGEPATTDFERLCDSISGFDRETLLVLKEFMDIDTSLLIVSTGTMESREDWINSLNKFRRAIAVINKKLQDRVYFHLAIKGPIPLGFALGIIFGSMLPFTIYHFQNNQYFPIEVSDVRYLKGRVKEQNYDPLVVSFIEGNGGDVAVVISMSHHEPLATAKSFLIQRFGATPSILLLEHPLKGDVPVEEYFEVARKMASVIQDVRGKRSVDKFHFFFSSPVSLAFLLGVVFGHYGSAEIYHYDNKRQTYINVISLDELKKIRENSY
ncbi:MAG: SAVED domain-containing protein [Candidatus Hydrothermia bacterium]